MNTVTRLARWVASTALATLLSALPIAAVEGAPTPGPEGSPPPQIDSYQPFPATWNGEITIHGSHLRPAPHPGTEAAVQSGFPKVGLEKAVAIQELKLQLETQGSDPSQTPTAPAPESSEPVLKWGAGDNPAGVVPASDIESWTSNQIRIKQLPGVQAGAYWIAVFQNGVRVSNRNRTLFFTHGNPDAPLTLQEAENFDEDDDDTLVAAAFPPVQEPTQLYSMISGYQPTVVGAGEIVQMNGYFLNQGDDHLMVGTGNLPLALVHPKWIKEWSYYNIRFENGFLPTGVYWVAVFNGQDLVSNLEWSLQVTEDPPTTPIRPDLLQSGDDYPRIPMQGQADAESEGQSKMQRLPSAPGTTGLQRMPNAPGATGLQRIPSAPGATGLQRIPSAPGTGRVQLAPAAAVPPRSRMQTGPRAKIPEPPPGPQSDAEASNSDTTRREKARSSAAPTAPAPVPSRTKAQQPAEREPDLQQRRLR
ncbi:MAG: hypothetical protein GY723_02700 [bacterium]|nr:hypothetical protein [bacterium]